MQEQIREFVCELSYIVLDNETAAFNLLNIYVYAWKKIQYIKYTEIIYNFIQKYWDACTLISGLVLFLKSIRV